MCGIFGLATGEGSLYQNKRPKIFKEGMHLSMLRGEDAAGMAGIREDKNDNNQKVPGVYYYKRALHVVDFMNTKGFDRMLNRFSEYYYVLGHVRASTVGGAEDRNAHPFMYDDITLVHNGTIHNAENKLKVKADENVDSAHIALAMALHGEQKTLEMMDAGAYSLVWHNAADDSLNFARNERKPMAIAFVKGRNEMYYASEWRMLWCLLGRNDIEIDGNIQITKPFTHYKFHKEDLRKWSIKPYTVAQPNFQVGDRWPGRGPVVHPPVKSTGTPTPANAKTADESTKNGQKSTSQKDTISAIDSPPAFGQRTEDRRYKTTEKVRNFGWEHGTQLILSPADFVPHTDPGGLGRLILDHPTNNYPEIIFVMYRVSAARYEDYENIGRVACYIDNFVEQNDGTLRLIMKEATDLQKVLTRQKEVFAKLEAHGYVDGGHGTAAKEEPKSAEHEYEDEKKLKRIVTGETASVIIDANTGEVLEEEESNDPVFEGPYGTRIALAEFRELCRAGCGYCDGDIDIRDYSRISWHGPNLICEHCTNDPTAQAKLNNTKLN